LETCLRAPGCSEECPDYPVSHEHHNADAEHQGWTS